MEFLNLPRPDDRPGLDAALAAFDTLGRSTFVRFEREGESIVGYYDERETAALAQFLSVRGFRGHSIMERALLSTERSRLTTMREEKTLKMVRGTN